MPGVTIDRQCGSCQQAVHFAAHAVKSGLSGLVAGGVQNMSQIPLTAAALVGDRFGHPDPYPGSRGWRKALADAGLTEGDIDAVEINEAFASVVLAWQREIDIAPERVDPVGGAIALGHPPGATGARLMTTMLHHLERTGARYGPQTMCQDGGQANITIVERL